MKILTWIALAFLCFFIGQYARGERWFSRLHEYGHVWEANQEGKAAYIDTPYTTAVDGAMTKAILASGYWMELLVWGALSVVFAFARWNGWGGAVCGFCLGFMTRVYTLAPLSTDFKRVGPEAFSQWGFYGLLTIVLVYLIVGARLWKWFKETRGDRGSNHGSH